MRLELAIVEDSIVCLSDFNMRHEIIEDSIVFISDCIMRHEIAVNDVLLW